MPLKYIRIPNRIRFRDDINSDTKIFMSYLWTRATFTKDWTISANNLMNETGLPKTTIYKLLNKAIKDGILYYRGTKTGSHRPYKVYLIDVAEMKKAFPPQKIGEITKKDSPQEEL